MIQLDILRGAAILLVLGRHAPIHPTLSGKLAFPFAGLWMRFGWTGVDLFFVLSGFLVGGLLFNEIRTHGRLDAKRFLIRRALKIWPAYYVFITFAWLYIYAVDPSRAAWWTRKSIPSFIHLQNYFGSVRGHTWSLAVEEHFYLVLPFVLALILRKRRGPIDEIKAVPYIAVGLIVFCNAARLITAHLLPVYDGELLLAPTHLRIDSLFFGVLLAYYYHFKPDVFAPFVKRRNLLLLVGFVLLSPMMVLRAADVPFVGTFGVTMLYLGYGCVLIAFLNTPVDSGRLGRLFSSRVGLCMAWIGTYSYGIYLWHADIGLSLSSYMIRHNWFIELPTSMKWLIVTASYSIAAVLGGALMSKLIEFPALKLRDRVFPTRASAPVHEPPSDPRPIASRGVEAAAPIETLSAATGSAAHR